MPLPLPRGKLELLGSPTSSRPCQDPQCYNLVIFQQSGDQKYHRNQSQEQIPVRPDRVCAIVKSLIKIMRLFSFHKEAATMLSESSSFDQLILGTKSIRLINPEENQRNCFISD